MKKLIFLLILVSSFASSASTEEEIKRLHKCYGILVRERISESDPLWKEVKAGKKKGTDACMEIFDKATFDRDGLIKKGKDGDFDYEGMRVLNTILRFHVGQLEVHDYRTNVGTGNSRFTVDVIDTNESAYHFLYSIFNPQEKYSNVVTRDYSIKAKRYSTKGRRTRSIAGGVAIPTLFQGSYTSSLDEKGVRVYYPAPAGVNVFEPELVETGILVGVEKDNSINQLDDSFYKRYSAYDIPNANVNEHHGAGIIGSQAYLLGNLGKTANSNGGSNLFRRWGKHVLSDLLCRDLPALRSRDVISEVHGNSTISFRTGISCMGCHSSMDPLAGAIRNIANVHSHNTTNTTYRVNFIAKINPTLGSAPAPTTKVDASFYKRPPEGKLYYRSFSGNLISHEFTGMEELGELLAKTDDLYVCAAKRYYRFLTGIDVDLSDPGDINSPELSEGAKFQRERVVALGVALKKHQSIRSLIKAIINSDAFIYPDKGV